MADSSDQQVLLGGQLRLGRRRARISQSDLAAAAGVARPTVRLAERGGGSLAVFSRLAHQAGLSITGGGLAGGDCLGVRLRSVRLRSGLGTRALGRATGICPAAIARMEAGGPSRLSTVTAVAGALGIHLRLSAEDAAPGFWRGGAGNSSVHQAWTSPPALLARLRTVFGGPFDLDPCAPASRSDPVGARTRYTAADDGLSLPWHGHVYLNPPYGRALGAWLRKALAEFRAGRARTVVALIAARTDTVAWHSCVAGHAHVVLLRGRLKFGARGAAGAAPFPSALAVWTRDPDLAGRLEAAFPDDWHVRAGSARDAAAAGGGPAAAGLARPAPPPAGRASGGGINFDGNELRT